MVSSSNNYSTRVHWSIYHEQVGFNAQNDEGSYIVSERPGNSLYNRHFAIKVLEDSKPLCMHDGKWIGQRLHQMQLETRPIETTHTLGYCQSF